MWERLTTQVPIRWPWVAHCIAYYSVPTPEEVNWTLAGGFITLPRPLGIFRLQVMVPSNSTTQQTASSEVRGPTFFRHVSEGPEGDGNSTIGFHCVFSVQHHSKSDLQASKFKLQTTKFKSQESRLKTNSFPPSPRTLENQTPGSAPPPSEVCQPKGLCLT